MPDSHTHFVRANLESNVVKIDVGARFTTYHLERGDRFRLNRDEMDALGRFVSREGFRIRLSTALKQRLGEHHR